MLLNAFHAPTPAILVLTAILPAQFDLDATRVRGELQRELELRRAEIERRVRERLFPYNQLPVGAPLPFHLGYQPGLRSMFPNYAGLPGSSGTTAGYGGYPPRATKEGPASGEAPSALLGRAERPADAWPSWVSSGLGREARKASAIRAVVAQESDRVWVLDPGESAFTPLSTVDKFRYLETGTQVRIRARGAMQVVFHDGASMRVSGPTRMAVDELSEQSLDLRVVEVERMLIETVQRSATVRLPDGSSAVVERTTLHLERDGDLYVVSNSGSGTINVDGGVFAGKLESGQKMSIWQAPPKRPQIGVPLQSSGGITSAEDGPVVTLRAGTGGGAVSWQGARFSIAAGEQVQLRSLAGRRFPYSGSAAGR